MKNKTITVFGHLLLFFMLQYHQAMAEPSVFPGIRIHFQAYEFIHGHFTDPAGNHLFMFTSGKNSEQGDAWILKMNPDGSDTILRSFALPDTATCFYTGFCTTRQTYLFFGQVQEDTLPYLSHYCDLWVLETDTLLQVISSVRYPIPQEYNAISIMKGYPLSEGKFTLAGIYTSPSTTWYSDDLFFAQFSDYGERLNSETLQRPLHQQLIYCILNLDEKSFSAIASGMNVYNENERIVVDSLMGYQEYSFLGSTDIQYPLSMVWLSDTLSLIAGEMHMLPYYNWDIKIILAGLSGVIYSEQYLGYLTTMDLPAMSQAVVRAPSDGFYLAGALRVDDMQCTDTVILCKIQSDCTIEWIKRLYNTENYVVHEIYVKNDGNILVAASYFDYNQPEYSRDLVFFTVDTCVITGSEDASVSVKQSNYRVYPNPGTNNISVENVDGGPLLLVIKDITGRQVLSGKSVVKNSTIDVSHLPQGMYFIELIKTPTERKVVKWLKCI